MLTITDLAKEKLAGFAAQADEADTLVLHVAIVGRGANGFQYDLQLISQSDACLLYTSPSPRDQRGSRMPSSA